ncbi:MAG: thiamine phosphate synthase [Rhodospirillales bacterium]
MLTSAGRTLADVARCVKRPQAAAHLPRLILMTDRVRLPDPLAAVERLPPGSAVIVREPEPARRAKLVRRLIRPCRRRRIRLLVAADARLAAVADGLHLPEALLRRGYGRWPARRQGTLLTAAAHSPIAIRRAAARAVDAVLLAPVFATASHPRAAALGPLRFARMVRNSPLPVYALGGIDATSARRLRGSGAAGFAAIGALAATPSHPASPLASPPTSAEAVA